MYVYLTWLFYFVLYFFHHVCQFLLFSLHHFLIGSLLWSCFLFHVSVSVVFHWLVLFLFPLFTRSLSVLFFGLFWFCLCVCVYVSLLLLLFNCYCICHLSRVLFFFLVFCFLFVSFNPLYPLDKWLVGSWFPDRRSGLRI